MAELLTAAQMRAIEQTAIDAGHTTGLDLMERAGQGVVAAIFMEWPELDRRGASPSRSPGYLRPDEGDPLRAAVLCGPGNNGGDGFVIARLLQALGWDVEVFLYGDAGNLPPDAQVNCEEWAALERVFEWDEGRVEKALADRHPDLVIDALFGTGMRRQMPHDTRRVRTAIIQRVGCSPSRKRQPKFVAVDCPSGLCSDSGANFGAFPADLTVTFHARKLGHVLQRDMDYGGGPDLCGRVVVADIGLQSPADREITGLVTGAVHAEVASKNARDHKYRHGHALILTGGPGKTGAARLAARGALRIGAGLVTLGVPPAAQLEVACQVTSIMVRRVDGPDMLADILSDDRLNALCLGPGLGVERAKALVPVALAQARATVLDADALSAFAEAPTDLFGQLHERSVLTPHGGEFARLFPDLAGKLAEQPIRGPVYSKVDAARDAARRAGCVVVFKGPDTVIAAPDGRCAISAAFYDRATPWLATAGAGDVFAGFLTGLLARGIEPMQAAQAAAWLHVECAREFGPGLIAEDLPDQLPIILNKLKV